MHAIIISALAALITKTGIGSNKIGFLKSFREIQSNFYRSLLVIFALILGLWGVGSLLISNYILRSDLKENYLRTQPPHLIINSPDFLKLNIEDLRLDSEIESLEFRDLALRRVEVYPGEWIPIWIFSIDDFNNTRLAHLKTLNGLSSPQRGGVIIERDGLLVSNLKIGDQARIQSKGKIIDVPIEGISFDPAQAPATQDHFIYAYTNPVTYKELSGEEVHQRLIVRFNNVNSEQTVTQSTNRLLGKLKKSGVNISTIKIPKYNEHPHQWQLNTLLLLQGSISILALFMAGVLVSQLISSVLAKQIRQIGIMKAIGASTYNIFVIYGFMILIFGFISACMAIPIARWTGFAFSRFVASKLNFDILQTELPSHLYIFLVLLGLILPLLLSLPALIRGMRVSVVEALSNNGVNQFSIPQIVTTNIFSTEVAVGLRNTFRNAKRLSVTVIATGIGVAIFSTGFNVKQALWNLLSEVDSSLRYGIQVVLRKPYNKSTSIAPFISTPGLQSYEFWNGGKGELQNQIVSADDGVGIVALPVDTKLVKFETREGRWLKKSENPEIVMNMGAIESYGFPTLNSTVKVNVRGNQIEATLVGKIWELDKPKIYISDEIFNKIANPDALVNSILFVGSDRSIKGIESFKKNIEAKIAASSLDVLYVMSKIERVKVVYDHLNIILMVLAILASLVLVVSALGMGSAMGINVMERTREIGVMRAIGASDKSIKKKFIVEGLTVSSLGLLFGLALSIPLGVIAAPFFGTLMLGEGATLVPAFSLSGLIFTSLVTIVFGYFSSFYPAKAALSKSTRESISYE